MHIDKPDLLLSLFLETDSSLWVRFVPSIAVKASYYCDTEVPRGSSALYRFLLIVTGRRVVLEAGPISFGHGLIFYARSAAREIAPGAPDLDCIGANWPSRGDPFMHKAQEIAGLCGEKFAPSPFKVTPSRRRA